MVTQGIITTNRPFASGTLGLGLAIALSATPARAQSDTTRRATSEVRIPVQKARCIRLRHDDMASWYENVPVGALVAIR